MTTLQSTHTPTEKGRRKGSRLASGALALSAAGLLVKVLGMIYKIPLTNLLGDEGMGYFNAAYTIYTLFFVLSTSGLPVALSLLIAEARATGERNGAQKIYSAASGLLALIGLAGALLMALPAKSFAALLGNEGAAAGILAVSPTLVFITVTSALRGYFQGYGYMIPTALSQVVEAAGKLLFGLTLAYAAIGRYALTTISAYAIFGLTLATFLAMLYLLWAKRRFDKSEGLTPCRAIRGKERKKLLRRLVGIAFPVTVSALAATLASSCDLFLVMRSLVDSGFTAAEANAAWGNYSSLAVPLFNMPTVLIQPLAYAISPYLRAALARGDQSRAAEMTRRALRLGAYLAIPAALGLSALAGPILSLIYTDAGSVATATPLLSILALAVFPLALLSVASTLLQAHGKLWFPIGAIGVGILVKVAVSRFALLRFGMVGAPLGTLACYTVVAALDLAYLARTVSFSPFALFGKPFLCALPTAAAAALSYLFFISCGLMEKLATLFSLSLAVIVFLTALVLTKALEKEDAAAFGLSEKTVRFLQKLHLMK